MLTNHCRRPQVMWTNLPCQNFHLLVCCAILDSEKQKIMEENYGFNEILKVETRVQQICSVWSVQSQLNTPVSLFQHINELSMKLDIEEILQKAEGISLQIRSCKVRSLSQLCCKINIKPQEKFNKTLFFID